MDRRHFITGSLAAGAVLSTGLSDTASADSSAAKPFKLKYAPTINRFREHVGNDPIDNIEFMHQQGFRAVFDNGLMGKSPEMQERIGEALRRRDMDLGPFVIHADFGRECFVLDDADIRRDLLNRVRNGIETAKRSGCKWGLMVPGRYNQRMDWGYQTANVIENLKYLAEACEESGLIIVLEPLNKRDHPGLFLTTIAQAYAICRAVNHPCCKIVNDLYHQQITEGNLIPNIDNAWSEIASFHVGDNPGRREPGTGEINYRNIFRHLYQKGYDGVICMEHGISVGGKEGEKVLIEAYRKSDDF